ncbi:glycosyltransferase family 2 protein [Hansschlegelia quercus]|uniref:Glycosyltransferase family 2 protein n=1 Tax=Hansschlegelia quercus TaxID=2528245 RepID=A0A4Q9G949_9HYPH|nr:glycosyltransferase family 2 protein [Hansschlegelia quercus]TBN47297.1 glycosyltransferase family 2 protein [Hansschlegelia quercus]
MIPVSVVIPTRNEAANLGYCLEALRRFDQVIVVDSGSIDATETIARQHNAEIIPFAWNRQYPKKKEWSLLHPAVRHNWVLMLDADEIVSDKLVEEIASTIARGPRFAAYFILGRFVFLGEPLRFGHCNCKIMLVDRRRTRFPRPDDLDIPGGWEVEGHYQPIIDGPIGRMRASLLHWDRKPAAAYFGRHDLYADWEARLAKRGTLTKLASTESLARRLMKTAFRKTPARWLVAFLHSYVLKLGFLDGAAGFHFAMARAFYYWQIALRGRTLAADARMAEEAKGESAVAVRGTAASPAAVGRS